MFLSILQYTSFTCRSITRASCIRYSLRELYFFFLRLGFCAFWQIMARTQGTTTTHRGNGGHKFCRCAVAAGVDVSASTQSTDHSPQSSIPTPPNPIPLLAFPFGIPLLLPSFEAQSLMTATWTRYTMHDNIIYGPVWCLQLLAHFSAALWNVWCAMPVPPMPSVPPPRPCLFQLGLINKSYIWIQIAALKTQKLQQKCQIWHEIIYARTKL